MEPGLCCRHTLLVNDMPLSSSPSPGSPPILHESSDNEGADSPKLQTKRGGGNQNNAPSLSDKLSPLLRLLVPPSVFLTVFRRLFKLVQIRLLIKWGTAALV